MPPILRNRRSQSSNKAFWEASSCIKKSATELLRIWKRPYNYFIFERTRSSILSNLQLDNFIHVTRPDKGWEPLILNKAYYYSKVNAILSDTYNSVSFIMILTNTVNYETRRCYQENRQKNPFPTSYFSSSIQFNLLLGIKIIW